MRCPSCNKFAAFEIQDPETDGLECAEGVVTGSLRLVLNTECCGDEAKENNFEVELDLSDSIIDELKKAGIAEPNLSAERVEFEVEDEGATADDRYDGKPGTPSRFRRHFYCVHLELKVTCKYPKPGGESITVTVTGSWEDEVQASAMEELA